MQENLGNINQMVINKCIFGSYCKFMRWLSWLLFGFLAILHTFYSVDRMFRCSLVFSI